MISPGFHSAVLLVHLSCLCVAIRRAWRDVIFFCVSTQFVMLYVSIFSSASLDSIQSSNSCSWLDVLSVSFSNEILLFRSHSSFVLSSFLDFIGGFTHFTFLNVFSSSVFVVYFCIFCLNDKMKHSALCCTDHFSCSSVVVHVLAPYNIVGVTTASKR